MLNQVSHVHFIEVKSLKNVSNSLRCIIRKSVLIVGDSKIEQTPMRALSSTFTTMAAMILTDAREIIAA